jgi:hypothetical protein
MRPKYQNRSLSKVLDTKVLALVRQFVSEQASDEPTLQLRLSAILAYVMTDVSLTRHKKPLLEKSIERALDVIKEEALDTDDDEAEELDSEFEGLEVNLMIPSEKEVNAVNRRITEMWGVGKGEVGVIDAGSTATPVTPAAVESGRATSVQPPPLPRLGSPKRKRKDKGEEGKSKRQKGEFAI